MEQKVPVNFFTEEFAAVYDTRFARLAPFRDGQHLLLRAVLAELPATARILCVGAGTGAELLALAAEFPGWSFTAVDPSKPMLDICRRRVRENGIESRCQLHEGFVDTLKDDEPFDAATALLVSQFCVEQTARRDFFEQIARRLRPGGILVSADLAVDQAAQSYRSLLGVWGRLQDMPDEKLAAFENSFGRDIAVVSPAEVAALITSAGFEPPVLGLQSVLIHTWYARRSKTLRV